MTTATHAFAQPRIARRVALDVPAAPLRLTRRGRAVVAAVFLLALLTVSVLLSAGSAATRESSVVAPTRSVVVGEGDTLWSLAAAVAAPGQIRATVHQIQKLNALPGPVLAEGQTLAVPAPVR